MDAQLTIVDVTGSTNDDLLEAGKQGAPHGTGPVSYTHLTLPTILLV